MTVTSVKKDKDYMEIINRVDELMLIRKYNILIKEYYNQLTEDYRNSLMSDIHPFLNKRGMQNMEEFFTYLSKAPQREDIDNRELLHLRMDLARIFDCCFEKMRNRG